MLDDLSFDSIVAKSGLSLASLGIRGEALRKPDALRALRALDSDGRAVLGGDVYYLGRSRIEPALANWYASQNAAESHEDFRRRSLALAHDYIARTRNPDDVEAVFSIVLEDL